MALIIGAVVVARPVYHFIREKRIDANLKNAQSALRLQDWETARNLARSVLITRPTVMEAFRVWFQALTSLKEPRTYIAAAQMFTYPKAEFSDRVEAFRVLCAQAPQAVALSAYASLPAETRDLTGFRAPIATFLLRRGEPAMAEKILRGDPNLKSSPEGKVALIRILCTLPSVERVREARELFASLMPDNSAESLEALLLLGKVTGGVAPEGLLADLRPWINSHPGAKTPHFLCAVQATILEKPGAADALYEQAAGRFVDSDPAAVGSWLVSQGQAARAVTLLKFAATTRADAYMARLRALRKMDMTADLIPALAVPPLDVDRVEMELIRAAVAHSRADTVSEKLAWDKAFQEATFDEKENRFLEISRYAAALGVTTVADDAAVAALRVGWGSIPLSEDFGPIFFRMAQENRIDELVAMYRVLLRFEPGNAKLRNNFLYLALLHNIITPAEAVQRLEELHKTNPQQPGLQSSRAFAYILNNEPERVLSMISAIEDGPLKNALHGTALLSAGKTDEAKVILAGVDWSKLLHQETFLLRKSLVFIAAEGIALPELKTPSPETKSGPSPAWSRRIEALEKARAGDVLPPLSTPEMPKFNRAK